MRRNNSYLHYNHNEDIWIERDSDRGDEEDSFAYDLVLSLKSTN